MLKTMTRSIAVLGTALGAALTASGALAQSGVEAALDALPVIGAPEPGGISLQQPVTEIARQVQWLDNFLLVIITAISLFVVGLLAYVILRYNRAANPTPARFTHHSPLEVAWTIIPVVILVVIGAVSLPVLFNQQEIPEADVTINVTGVQWYWSYEYVDEGIAFDSFMLTRDELADYGYDQSLYRLATDTAVVIPVGATIVMNVTASDVIHSWKVPAFGVMQDGVPGRDAQLWFAAETEGVYFGQCSELCGKDHAYMPITVKVVSPEVYAAWVTEEGGEPTAYIREATAVETAALAE